MEQYGTGVIRHITGLHKHQCHWCGFEWEHEERERVSYKSFTPAEVEENIKDHTCPKCGREAFFHSINCRNQECCGHLNLKEMDPKELAEMKRFRKFVDAVESGYILEALELQNEMIKEEAE